KRGGRSMSVTRRTLVLFVLVLVPITVFGQSTTGSLSGTVTSQGAPLPGVNVTATSPALQGSRSAVSGEGGGYNLPNLPPGNYVLSFELAGMQRIDKRV